MRGGWQCGASAMRAQREVLSWPHLNLAQVMEIFPGESLS
jgi:hypothetical protein